MHAPPTLTIPHWRAAVRHAVPNIVEGKLVPVLLFVGLLQMAGSTAALLGALAWAMGALVRRLVCRKPVSGLLVLTTLGLGAKTVAALASGSLFIYFLQPTVATALVGLAFVASVPLGRPLVERLAMDFCPFDDDTRAHPTLRRFFKHASLWWGFTSAVNFGITLHLLLERSPTTFVLVKSVLGPLTTTVTLVVAYLWFRALMARSGTQVVFARAADPIGVPAAMTAAA